MLKATFPFFALLLSVTGHAQTLETDTLRLNEVTVRAFESNRRLLETAAPVNLLGRRDLQQRFAGTPTLVPAMNTLPGVRMEERSPGSYRLSIRGSSLRSPFGVRNVKVYWNDLPLTDAGGNTYLNAIDIRSLGRVEVIKGPAGSLYGAGTGGTLLLSGLNVPAGAGRAEVGTLAGSYGLFGHQWTVQSGKGNNALSLNYNHLQSDGYRQNSSAVHDNLNLMATFRVSPDQSISVLGFYSDLNYRTPGGLNEAQYRADPRQARPSTRTVPGSVDQQAGIYQKTGYLGVSHLYRFSQRVQNTTVLYGSLVDFANPFITNYEKRADQGVGGRTTTQVQLLTERLPTVLTFGAEWQHNFTITRNYGNRRGVLDTLQTDDELKATQSVLFAQTETDLPLGFRLTLGLSRNEVAYGFTRFSTVPVRTQTRAFEPVWLPRVALLKKIGETMSVFGSLSTGYSAPTVAEIRPSERTFNTTLQAERGVNAEIGLRGRILDRLQFDVAAYRFALRESITRRTTEDGSEFFVNAGRTEQLGLETQLAFDLVRPGEGRVLRVARLWNNLTLNNYRFRDFRQGAADVSGNRITGVAPTVVVSGLDLEIQPGFYAHVTQQFIDRFPLTDANTVQSEVARLLNATVGFRRAFGAFTVDAFASGDNLLDQTYSLGYDLNAFGGRYYNASARRNFSGGVRLGVRF
ncbi:TonB-dependent receptor [Tellurirhabdus rosea]|uniref:TonB-dependent receptor n=1 Tax=Tellurirhabdus rosea TaxID=2674997 RepID=UPI0022578CED|nr:TonB-dependent receptor plug domain-containing protein [Tellurirhabdus rosea]